ncbi:dynamin family protein [Tropicimonas sp. TH_r6]|uniref:dynamin family protein n=1 Tax=Tropicimonas sp. TH_r6 TaxID=3082085 RepID=UPI002952E77D|nr:dynamin family protein [Tropicimonas sp. TH_r6]MDV7141148.1 dynamin family protein [Tropicimonas sp. TH_r6]
MPGEGAFAYDGPGTTPVTSIAENADEPIGDLPADLAVECDAAASLFRMCLEGLSPALAQRTEVLEILDELIAQADSETAVSAQRLRKDLCGLEPAVTMIGQVKAGKTSLVNAMIGAPGLLPADVNPWTSVVTSLHVCPEATALPYAARFSFFEPEDWDRLTRKGGRIGELAGRSGAEEEAEKIRAQIEAMRDKTRRRLGRKFELLLGTSHEYGKLSKDLIERYVCLGDDFEDEEAGPESQGRFADITKAAELNIARPDWPMGLCLRDTPGVNDTFMMREQITIGAIRDSRLSVVVLSAHQALSAVDMALIRLISNVRSREVIIFVNRIDELSDPVRQIEEIRESIRETLRAHHGPHEAQIVFGSAHWANLALKGDLSVLDDEASEVLLGYAEHVAHQMEREFGALELIWWLSGVPALYGAIWNRVTEGAARERLQSVSRAAMNLATGLSAAAAASPGEAAAAHVGDIDVPTMEQALGALEGQAISELDRALQAALEAAGQRLERAHQSFLERATAALLKHLDSYGEMSPWSYDPAGLRLLLRSGFQVFARQLRGSATASSAAAAEQIAGIYARALGRSVVDFNIQPPVLPRLAPPVLIGQTIALDLKGNWWRRWWSRRRGYERFAPEFHAMIEAETRPIVTALKAAHCEAAALEIRQCLQGFFDDQRAILANIGLRATGGGHAAAQPGPSSEALAEAVARLSRFAA